MTFRQTVKQLAGYIGSGLIAIFPAAMTVWVISAVVRWLAEMFGTHSLLGHLLEPRDASPLSHGLIMAAVYGVVLLGIGYLGYRTQKRASSWVVGAINLCFSRFPLVNRIHHALQQVANVMRSQTGEDAQGITKFGDVVVTRFASLQILALLTSRKVYRIDGEPHVQVFIPHAPLPATGWLFFARVDEVLLTSLDIEAYTKIAVSFGSLTGQTIPSDMKTWRIRASADGGEVEQHETAEDTTAAPPDAEAEPKPKRRRKPKPPEPTEEATE